MIGLVFAIGFVVDNRVLEYASHGRYVYPLGVHSKVSEIQVFIVLGVVMPGKLCAFYALWPVVRRVNRNFRSRFVLLRFLRAYVVSFVLVTLEPFVSGVILWRAVRRLDKTEQHAE